jgi:hypothetical protein
MSILEKLTEGMVPRDLHAESHALVEKWERTGLLEGLGTDEQKNQMSRLLENQAKELLRESSTMQGGDVEGFAAVAFPLVRRVFGSLVAQDLVSVQPMSLPSGLIFFLDFTFSGQIGTGTLGDGYMGNATGSSIYGGGRVAAQITGGVVLAGENVNNFRFAEQGPYGLNNGFSSPTASVDPNAGDVTVTPVASGTIDANGDLVIDAGATAGYDTQALMRFDPDICSPAASGSTWAAATIAIVEQVPGQAPQWAQLNRENLVTMWGVDAAFNGAPWIRRLTTLDRFDPAVVAGGAPTNYLVFAQDATATNTAAAIATALGSETRLEFAIDDDYQTGGALGSVVGDPQWGLENTADIPEIDIKVDSVSVTAMTKKLKAKWTPELGQDLNAYHNLDAEVELTSILSEQIALEIDREILEDLVVGAEADTQYWSRRPGKFVNPATGADLTAGGTVGPDFTGNVSEWYETLLETINDVSAQIHRKTLRGGANFVVVSPEMANILEFTAGFRASVTHDDDRGTIGAVKVGSLSKKFDVFVDPYFLRNVVLVGRRGASFLESGYVYAPYVPLQVTPTIFGVEDFVPRKGVMTRYAKKMVRPDMYGLVIVSDFLG